MAGERTTLTVQARESLGSRNTRRLRKQGFVPGVLYGRGEPVAISIEERELRRALTGAAGLHSILDVEIDGKGSTHASILKDYQQDPIRGHISHIDLQEVRLDQPIQAQVSVQLVGEPRGVTEGGVLSQVSRDVRVEGLPMSIPEHLELDVTEMGIGDTMRLADLTPPEDITFLDDPEEVVLATVTLPTQIVEPEPEEEELEEGVEVPEGEEAAEAPAEGAEAAAGEPGTTEG
jgi:large subunit ribosomal protein L25